ncbi:MAG: arylsulfatase [Verrucomicrobiota bacterium]
MHLKSVILLAASLATPLAIAGAAPPRPNIVLIMADDMGFSDIGCYGGEIRTPNLDRLAAEGMRFTQFYNNAKCTTTRASLLTGLYARQTGGLLTSKMVTLGEALRLCGYQTSLSGKWHLGSKAPNRPVDRGFDEYYGLMDGCCNFFNPSQPDPPFKGGRVRTWGHNDKLITEFPADFYSTDAIADHAAKTIRRFSAAGKPFFAHVTFTAPHYPLHAKPQDIAKYAGKYSMGWEGLRRQRYERQLGMGLIDPKWPVAPRDSLALEWDAVADQEWQASRMAVYAAMVDAMDQGIGRILKALKESGVEQNTLVMFLSDNGGCAEQLGHDKPGITPGLKENYTTVGPSWAWAQNTPFRRFKAWVHEGGISTPLIAHWPGRIKPNSLNSQVGHIIDFMPTFLELAGGKYPEKHNGAEILPVEGLSLVPVLEGRPRAGHAQLFWEWSGNRAMREGDWKLVWDDKAEKRWHLYELKGDRTETRNLAADHPDRVKRMSEAWLAWAERTGTTVGRKKAKAAN